MIGCPGDRSSDIQPTTRHPTDRTRTRTRTRTTTIYPYSPRNSGFRFSRNAANPST
ncbi:hypothetical protein GCM10027059_04860 [Myceligenerans halotolerans]